MSAATDKGVLAVLDRFDIIFDIGTDKSNRDDLREARATVAGLIEALNNIAALPLSSTPRRMTSANKAVDIARAALARCNGEGA